MKHTFLFLIVFLSFVSCDNTKQNKNDTTKNLPIFSDSLEQIANDGRVEIEENNTTQAISYATEELVHFLDSIGNLPLQVGLDKVSQYPDSMFMSRLLLSEEINLTDFEKLKNSCKKEIMNLALAEKLFKHTKFDKEEYSTGEVSLSFHSFSKTDSFKQFAINPLYTSDVYFFSENKIISKHLIHNKYGLELEHYKNASDESIIYYRQNYVTGTGIWWYNFHFYKYKNDALIPILNEIQNANLQPSWHIRSLWLETSIVKTKPLTLKMVYKQSLRDTFFTEYKIVEDSTTVSYFWDEESQTLKGNYNDSKISKPQILSYYLDYNEFLFIKTHYKILKTDLNSTDMKKRLAIFKYLDEVKHHISAISKE